ncbi:MAG: hypothetical protein AAGD96_32410, partial [Chloroflexota bacterium]
EFYSHPTNELPTKEIFYPYIGNSKVISAMEPNPEPIEVTLPGTGTNNYFVYTTDEVAFYKNLPVGSWVLVNLGSLVQIESCLLNQQLSQSSNLSDHILSSYPHVPTSSLIYDVKNVPSQAQLQLGGTEINVGDQFSGEELDEQGLTITGSTQNQSLSLSASGTYRVSADNEGNELQNGDSSSPAISADGKIVAYQTDAVFDVGNDLNGQTDIIKWDEGTATLVSREFQNEPTVAGRSVNPAITPHGGTIAFESSAVDLIPVSIPCSAQTYIFVHKTSGVIEQDGCRTADSWGGDGTKTFKNPTLGTKGQLVFETDLPLPNSVIDVDSNEGSDIISGTVPISFVSRTVGGGPFDPLPPVTLNFTGNQASSNPDISADGRTVAFDSNATDLVSLDTNGFKDVFIKREGSIPAIVSISSAEQRATGGTSSHPSISRFGEHIAFSSTASGLTDHETEGVSQIYVRDEAAGCTVIASVNGAGVIGNGGSFFPSISANGQFVAFQSFAANLANDDTNNFLDIFVFDRDADRDGSFYEDTENCQQGPFQIKRVSVASDGTQADGASAGADMSDNGEFVAFSSFATNLVDDDENNVADVFVHYLGFDIELEFSETAPTPEPTVTPEPSVTPELPAENLPYKAFLPLIIR